jgi:hypothetical protein
MTEHHDVQPSGFKLSNDYQMVAQLTCKKVMALIREGWNVPLAIDVTNADNEPVLGLEYDGHCCNTAGDRDTLLPDLKFPITVSITDSRGQSLLLEISEEDLLVN